MHKSSSALMAAAALAISCAPSGAMLPLFLDKSYRRRAKRGRRGAGPAGKYAASVVQRCAAAKLNEAKYASRNLP